MLPPWGFQGSPRGSPEPRESLEGPLGASLEGFSIALSVPCQTTIRSDQISHPLLLECPILAVIFSVVFWIFSSFAGFSRSGSGSGACAGRFCAFWWY